MTAPDAPPDWLADAAPVRRLSEIMAGMPLDRPLYILDDIRQWGTFTAPAGPHAGHRLMLVRVRPNRQGNARRGVVRCLRCRCKWSFREFNDPRVDPHSWRPPIPLDD